jgi:hypothetical protein
LSCREKELLGRSLAVEEARYVSDVTRRITAILLLTPDLNANYETAKRNCFPWRSDRMFDDG